MEISAPLLCKYDYSNPQSLTYGATYLIEFNQFTLEILNLGKRSKEKGQHGDFPLGGDHKESQTLHLDLLKGSCMLPVLQTSI